MTQAVVDFGRLWNSSTLESFKMQKNQEFCRIFAMAVIINKPFATAGHVTNNF